MWPVAQSYNIIQLFLTANLLTSTSTIPVLLGLWHTPLGLKVRLSNCVWHLQGSIRCV